MSRNLRKWILLITIVILSSATAELRASHAMGADMTYECLGSNTYKIRVSFYRDCIGVSAPGNVYVNVRSTSCNQNLGVTCNRIPGTGQEVNYLCPTAVSTCNGGTFTGIQEYVYEGIITLPAQCADWVFSYSLCCRNAAITTLRSPGANTFFIYATLNNLTVQCNSSPQFSNKPVPFACLGQELCFNHGAFDADGDSLVYTLVDPKQTASTNVNYLAPYSATNPLNSVPAMQFNTQTGDICFTPTQLQVTVMAVLVSEYRNGLLIGTVVRDIQVTVLNCNNDLPELSGINGTNDFNMTVCADEPVCFTINSSDLNATQQLTLVSNNAIPTSTFNASPGLRPTGTFCWTPTKNDISSAPHCFTVQVIDDACPFNGSQTYSYCLTVKGITVNSGPDQSIACSDLATLTANATGGNPPYTYLWSIGFTNPTQTVPVGTYVVTVSDGLCSSTDTVIVVSAFEPIAAFQANSGCASTAITFNDQSTTPGTFSFWTWNFGDGNSSNLQNPLHTYANPGTYQVSLTVENIYGCIDSVVQTILVNPLPVASFANGTACAGSAISFTNSSLPAGTSWNWSFSNGASSTLQNPSVVFDTAGTYTATLIVQDVNGCIDSVAQSIVVSPVPVAAFSNSVPLCIGSSVQFTDLSTGNPVSWQWSFGNGLTSTFQNPVTVYNAGGNYPVNLIVTNAAGCTSVLTRNINILTPPTASAGPDVNLCLGSSITLTANGGSTYTWQPGNLSGSSIVVSPSSNSTYTVITTDVNGCTNADTINVNVLPLPVAVTGPDQTICSGNSVNLTASGGVSYSWSPIGATTQNVTVTPSGSGTYAVNVTGANGCTATAFVNVNVRPLPVLNLPVAVFFCNGVNSVLDPGAGSAFQWSTGATSQTITVNTAGTYSVTVTNQFGCTATANTQVTVGGQIVNNNPAAVICQGQSAILNTGQSGISYLWSTGATTQTISVSAAGTYQVTVTEPTGCTGVISNTVIVNPLPVVNFTPVDVCISSPVQFTDLSVINGGAITSWYWDLGDGNVSFQQNPSHNYTSPGSFLVTLSVTSADGCTASFTDTVNVYPLPNANFSYNFACEGTPIPFIDQSSTQFGNIISWYWDFKDVTTSNLQNPQHAFPSAGTYNVELTVATAGGCTDTRSRVIHIYPKPDVSFITDRTTICTGETVVITNTSTTFNGGINDWSWVFGDGTISAHANPTHTYTTPGTYQIQLTATTSHGCVDTASASVTVYPLPVANAGNDQAICIGNSATLVATGGGTYSWMPGGATSASITVTPPVTTTYIVTVTSAQGCIASDSVIVTVIPRPVANAGADRGICVGRSTLLTATGGTSYVWSTGAVSPTISVNPVVTTSYVVTVTGSNGCISSDTVVVTANPLPAANAGSDQVICTGTTATLSASGGAQYLWSPGGATTQNIYVTPTVASTYVVLVTDANGCSRSDSVLVSLNPTPVVNMGSAFFCAGYSATLNAGNPGMSYEWAPGGETTQTITVTKPGLYSVVVTNSFGCNGSGTVNVVEGGTSLGAAPIAMHGCAGETITLDASNPGMSYSWSTGANSQTIAVTTGGLYTVTVTDAGGCSATFTDSVTIHPLPIAAFAGSSNCFGSTTTFTDNTFISFGTIMNWDWNLGNGYSASVQHPTFLYTQEGSYNVVLSVTSGMGCRDTVTGTIVVHPSPVAAFTADGVCHGGASQFNNTSTVATGSIATSFWNFGDGNSSAQLNALYAYANPGTYTVSLVTGTSQGCTDTLYGSVTVFEKAVPSFIAFPVCEGATTQFINTSSAQNANISDYTWDFGDGTGSSDQQPVHLYSAPGVYNVKLTVGTDANCIDSVEQQVVVHARPLANVTVTPVCEGAPVTFINNSTPNGGGPILSYFWNFGNGVYSGMQQPVYTYPGNGNFNVSLIVGSVFGCTDTFQTNALVHGAPVASFTATSGCMGTSTQFTFSGSSNAVAFDWNFGDMTLGVGANPGHNYTSVGSYNVSMIATSASGCRDTSVQSVNVFPVPVANFFSANVCLQNQMVFTDLSSVNGGGAFQQSWSFGDGNNASGIQVNNNYLQAGLYTVQLTVVTAQGCSATVSKPVQVYDLPLASFTANDVCLNLPTNFDDNSSITNGQITGWNWTLGDGSISNMQNPTHTYGLSGTFPVNLQVTSNYGCRNNASDTVSILRLPTPQPFSLSGCVGENRTFSDLAPNISPNDIQSWSWDFGNGLTSTQSSPVAAFTTSGTQVVTLTTTNLAGCRATAQVSIMTNPLPVAGFTNSNACDGTAVQFNNTSSIGQGASISGYNWNFGDGTLNSNLTNPSHTFAQAGTYTITLVAISNEGCTDTISRSITVHSLPIANFIHQNVAGCGPLIVAFTDSSYVPNGSISTWFWNFGDGGSSTIQNPVHTYAQTGNYAVSLTVTSNNGCMNTSTINNAVTVYPSPNAMFTASPPIQSITNPVFDFINQSTGALTYNWLFGDGTGSPAENPSHTYADTGNYRVTLWVTNSYGCRDSISRPIRVEPIFTFFIPNAFTPNEDGVNDNFYVKGISIVDVKLSIFNRWGDQIYYKEGQHEAAAWDGSVIGEPEEAKQDVYVYQVYVTDVWGKIHERVGHVSLVR
jgi:gliding motility-associated-like protein